MTDRTSTRDHNIEVLHNIGYQKERNTTVFKKGSKYILSPAVSEQKNGQYWFDVREVNIKRVTDGSLLLVRIVPDLFIIETLMKLSSLFSDQIMDNRPNSGNVWGIHINLHTASRAAFLFNRMKPENKISTALLSKKEVVDFYNNFERKCV